ncbi:protein containing C-terminal region of TrgB protein [Beggiatoa alba B18LD]|uniref:ADP-ribose pyrophosphatase n=1 Tax=Beggiatoa alba B18LD TaxID=395493 RepID=I3CDT3_9GAMM|nr:NUDIX domain-containing protein [Beggiatoa alba]EIJ41776.1 protein containing C-terminal region of TrgB protein [Beggiatoa alba B18LD]
MSPPYPKKIELVDKILAYNGYFKIVKYHLRHTLFRGGWSGEMSREVFERGHAVALLPYDPIREQVVLVEQFRAGALSLENPEQSWLWEIIAGIIEPEETPIEVAHREAEEEAGCRVTDLIPLHKVLLSPGGTTETCQLYCGRVDASTVGGIYGLAEENEDIQVHVVTLDEALALIDKGIICSSPAIIALQWLALHKAMVKQRWQVA